MAAFVKTIKTPPAFTARKRISFPFGLVLLALVLPAHLSAFLPRDSEGWTILEPAADTIVTHVSSSTGNDGNDGTVESPVATLGEAYERLRNDSADWMLLKRGDTWEHTFPEWFKRGRSASEPLVIGSYGEGPRPLILPGDTNGIRMWGYTFSNTWGYSNMVFTDLHFQSDWSGAQSGDNPSGFRIDRPGENLLFENLRIERFATNLTLQAVSGAPMGENIQVRRCILVDAFAKRDNDNTWNIPGVGGSEPGFPGGGHSQGIYTSRLNTLLIEENVIDRNGWDPEIEGAERTIFNHNLYIQSSNTENMIIRSNIIARGASHGSQLRPGGVLEGNLYVGNSLGAFIGGAGGRAEGNVFVHGSRDTLLARTGNYSGPRGQGLSMQNVSGSEALSNLIMHTPDGTAPLKNLNGVVREGNIIYEWGTTTEWDSGLYGDDPIQTHRTLYAYDDSLGGEGTVESFLAEARTFDRDNWRIPYTAKGAVGYFFMTRYDEWVLENFSDNPESPDADPDADPNHSGRPNALEFLLGLDPNVIQPPPAVHYRPGADGAEGMVYPKVRLNHGMDFSVRWSPDLQGWGPLPGDQFEVVYEDSPFGEEFRQVFVRSLPQEETNGTNFFRLRLRWD